MPLFGLAPSNGASQVVEGVGDSGVPGVGEGVQDGVQGLPAHVELALLVALLVLQGAPHQRGEGVWGEGCSR